jgi:hypothetical protein
MDIVREYGGAEWLYLALANMATFRFHKIERQLSSQDSMELFGNTCLP